MGARKDYHFSRYNWIAAQNRLQRKSYQEGLRQYHLLAQEYHSLNRDSAQKLKLVENDKIKAAMMFYYGPIP